MRRDPGKGFTRARNKLAGVARQNNKLTLGNASKRLDEVME